MAKIYGLSGAITGRRGADVFAITNGIQTVRQYQPIVANPRTPAQLTQRCKVNTAGRLSKYASKDLLRTMAMANARMNRSKFNSIAIKAVNVTVSGADEYQGALNWDDVKFGQGAAYVKSTITTAAAFEHRKLTVSLTLADPNVVNKYMERIVIVCLNPDGVKGGEGIVYQDVLFDATTAKAVTVSLPATIEDGCWVSLYRIPIDLTEEGMRIATRDLNADDSAVSAMIVATDGLVESFGESVYENTMPFVYE